MTPTVTNTSGWIGSSTKTGSTETIYASDLVSGNIELQQSTATDVTNYATATVMTGSEGTPVATKGDVTNYSIDITPTVTNTTGWIGGSTVTGTVVNVSAAELVSGTLDITAGTDSITVGVTNYASATVSPTPSESKTVTENGTVTPSSGKLLSSVIVNLSYNTYLTGNGEPSSDLGNDGDIYFDLDS